MPSHPAMPFGFGFVETGSPSVVQANLCSSDTEIQVCASVPSPSDLLIPQ